jgi:CDP-glycerol glycerophosphotransferase (TagB/SpsB family)
MLKTLVKNREKLLLGWGLLVPLACLVPKKKNLIVFIGENREAIAGNLKYFYLYLTGLKDKGVRFYYLTENKNVYKALRQQDLPVTYYPSLLSIFILLRAKVIVASDTPWVNRYKYHLLFKAKKVQLWHGIPLKSIQLSIPVIAERSETPQVKLENTIRGKGITSDLFVSTSEFCTKNAFSKAFRSRHFLESGYPRNDVLFSAQQEEYEMLGTDEQALAKIREFKSDGYKIVLYAPTYRDLEGDPVSDGVLCVDRLSEFARQHKIAFVFKFHAYTKCSFEPEKCKNIIWYDGVKDIQPILKLTDLLITDYSSVYMDYLLLDRPVVFFPYDYEKYTGNRLLLFDYDWITPGPKCYSQEQLHQQLDACLCGGEDIYSAKRQELCRLLFKYKDGKASERIWDYMKTHFLKTSSKSKQQSNTKAEVYTGHRETEQIAV